MQWSKVRRRTIKLHAIFLHHHVPEKNLRFAHDIHAMHAATW